MTNVRAFISETANGVQHCIDGTLPFLTSRLILWVYRKSGPAAARGEGHSGHEI